MGELFNYDFNRYLFYELNDGIGRLQNYLEKNEPIKDLNPTFYFIHHMSPHYPYITDSNCSYEYKHGEINYEGYKSAYLCNIKKILAFINYIEKEDPEAYVIFQSDHGWKFPNSKNNKKEIFNLLKVNNDCNIENNINYNNVNALKLVFSCILNDNPNYLKN